MGAMQFDTVSYGKTPKEAFWNAVNEANHDYGHAGYTGTIAEKGSFKLLEIPKGKHKEKFIENAAMDNDKWGPALCVKVKCNTYRFFGWASS
tara:strand:- start:1905 stop:2180 length:276 start_codon:yes stop_codon:yes gene_type:complete